MRTWHGFFSPYHYLSWAVTLTLSVVIFESFSVEHKLNTKAINPQEKFVGLKISRYQIYPLQGEPINISRMELSGDVLLAVLLPNVALPRFSC